MSLSIAERYIEGLSVSVLAGERAMSVRSTTLTPCERSGIERDPYAVHVSSGALLLALTAQESIDLGDALIRAGHFYRSHAHERLDQVEAATNGEPA